MTILKNLCNRDQPAFACNRNGRIVEWNAHAERLFGHASSDMIGRHCFEVLDGKDVFGNRFCHERCAIRSMIGRRESINLWQVNYRTASSARIDVSVSAVVVNGDTASNCVVVHLLEPAGNPTSTIGVNVPDKSGSSPPLEDAGDADTDPVELTAREQEILRLLSAGRTTAEIVSHLCISPDTVRTHVRNILNKLNAHSRLEAVSVAIRRRLV